MAGSPTTWRCSRSCTGAERACQATISPSRPRWRILRAWNRCCGGPRADPADRRADALPGAHLCGPCTLRHAPGAAAAGGQPAPHPGQRSRCVRARRGARRKGRRPLSVLHGRCRPPGNPAVAKLPLDAGASTDDGESVYHAAELADTACLVLLFPRGVQAPTGNLAHPAGLGSGQFRRCRPDPGERAGPNRLHWALFRSSSCSWCMALTPSGPPRMTGCWSVSGGASRSGWLSARAGTMPGLPAGRPRDRGVRPWRRRGLLRAAAPAPTAPPFPDGPRPRQPGRTRPRWPDRAGAPDAGGRDRHRSTIR
jgi:hypothetical protein